LGNAKEKNSSVDDEEWMRRVIAELVQRKGYDVLQASSAQAAAPLRPNIVDAFLSI
jgi:CheY-like chemotaxis protein